MISENLKEIIKNRKITTYKLAKKSNLSLQTIYPIVSGKVKNPKLDTLQKIAKGLNCTVNDLIETRY